MSEEHSELSFIHQRGDPFENTIGRINSIPINFLLGTPEASLQSPSKKVGEEIKEKLKNTKTKGKIDVYMGHSPFFREMKRLFQNDRRTNFFLRMGLGIPSTIAGSILAGKLSRADHYNPFSESVHVYHPNKAVALHEIGHALDFDKARLPGLKAVARILPPFTLKQEWQASRNAMKYLDRNEQQEAAKILEPAFGTYVGAFGGSLLSRLTSLPLAGAAYIGAILLGHLHSKTSEKNIFFNGKMVESITEEHPQSNSNKSFIPAIA